MSQLYNHNSGDYQDYLAVRAQEQTQLAIKKASQQQTIATAVCTTHLSNRLDNVSSNISEVNNNLVRMETGIKTSIDQNTYAVVASSQILQHTFLSGFDSINNTLDMGFAGVSSAIGELASAVSAGFTHLSKQMSEMQNEICDRLDKIHDIVNNPILTQSREMYRRAVTNYEKGFYEEALEDIKQAVEKNKTDYISWYLMGKIYLYGVSQFSNTVNLDEAINSFTNAAKYITPDLTESQDAIKLASEIYYHYAFTYYVKATQKLLNNEDSSEDLKKSIDLAVQSNTLSNKMLESLYMVARCEELLGNREKVLKLADQLIEEDSYYALKFVDDPDFAEARQDIFDLIEEKRQTLYNSFAGNIDKLKTYLNNYEFHDTPFAQQVLSDLQMASKINEKTPYLDLVYSKINHSYLVKMFENEDFPCDELLQPEDEEAYATSYESKIDKIKKEGKAIGDKADYDLLFYLQVKKGEETDKETITFAKEYEENIKEDSDLYRYSNDYEFACKISNEKKSWKLCCGLDPKDEYNPFMYYFSPNYKNYPSISPIKLDSNLKVKNKDYEDYTITQLECNYFNYLNDDLIIHIKEKEKFSKDFKISYYTQSIKNKKVEEDKKKAIEEDKKKEEELKIQKEEEEKQKQKEEFKKEEENKIRLNHFQNLQKREIIICVLYVILGIATWIIGAIQNGAYGFAIGMFINNIVFMIINTIFNFEIQASSPPKGFEDSGVSYILIFFIPAGLSISISGIIFHFITGFWKKTLVFIVVAAVCIGLSFLIGYIEDKIANKKYDN